MRLKFSLLIIALLMAGCSLFISKQTARIHIAGSDTMLILTRMLAENYMKDNPGLSIYVDGGGTKEGVKALTSGNIDICTASRLLLPEEMKMLSDYYGTVGMYHLIAKDALSIYVHPDNPVDNLTTQALKDIFLCKTKKWNELGGDDIPIVPVVRNPASGTYHYFKEHILLNNDYCADLVSLPTTSDVTDFVKTNPGAIGYGGIGYGSGVKHIAVNGVTPDEENARRDIYPITRYLHFFTSRQPDGNVKRFIDWVLSPSGQRIIRNAGYIPLWKIEDK